jgi:aryl-alcohol dehydrogenase (NADP+)
MKLLGLQRANRKACFVSMQNHYNLLYREEEREMIPLCRSEGIGVIPWSPLARGLLTRPHGANDSARQTSDAYTPKLYGSAHDAAIIGALEREARKHGVPMAQLALSWLLSQPGVTAPIVGATKPDHLETAIKAVDSPLDPAIAAELEKHYRPRTVAGID